MEFMEKLMEGIEANMIPAHAPIEQRWSASSSSLMSPAHGPPGTLVVDNISPVVSTSSSDTITAHVAVLYFRGLALLGRYNQLSAFG